MFSIAHAPLLSGAVADYRLSIRAEADLIAIYADSEAQFGAYQAEAYFSGLRRTFELIADFPRIGLRSDEIAPAHRRFRFQSHYVFYTVEVDHVLIRTVVHVRMNLRPDLFD